MGGGTIVISYYNPLNFLEPHVADTQIGRPADGDWRRDSALEVMGGKGLLRGSWVMALGGRKLDCVSLRVTVLGL